MPWHRQLVYYLQVLPLRLLRGVLRPLPDGWRNGIMSWLGRRVILNIPALRRRIADNLALVMPELSAEDRRRIMAGNAGKIGRSMLDMLDSDRMVARAAQYRINDTEGYRALKAAHAEGQGVILIGAHFGRFDAARAALRAHDGIEVAGIYRPQNNPFFNAELVANFEKSGRPMFARGRSGMRAMIKHLRGGGIAAVLIDQRIATGEQLDFMGQPALTSTDIAELALRLKLPVIPGYTLRAGSGDDYVIDIEPPIPHTDPITMTQAMNDSLAARIRQDPTEWYWLHRRWKMSDRKPKTD